MVWLWGVLGVVVWVGGARVSGVGVGGGRGGRGVGVGEGIPFSKSSRSKKKKCALLMVHVPMQQNVCRFQQTFLKRHEACFHLQSSYLTKGFFFIVFQRSFDC